jgi:hypothetical protein
MVITSTAGSPRNAGGAARGAAPMSAPVRRELRHRWTSLLVIVCFFTVQAVALSHEIQHLAGQHDEPCGLHDAAEHVAMATAPEPALAVVPAPAADRVTPTPGSTQARPSHPSAARAPPALP